MRLSESSQVTRLLAAWSAGDDSAFDRLMPLLYAELHALAAHHLRDERARTLQTTALVHEAYLRLVGNDVAWEGRRHFLAVAARTMRRVLVDHARARQRVKRGGGQVVAITLVDAPAQDGADALDVIAVDRALQALSLLDERKARAVELHYFGGLDYLEVARVLEISPVTVHRDLRFARSWLYDQLRSA